MRFQLTLLFVFLMLGTCFRAPVQSCSAEEATVRFQARSQTEFHFEPPVDIKQNPFQFKGWEGYDFQMVYQSVRWNPKETAVCVVDFGTVGPFGTGTEKSDALLRLRKELEPAVGKFLVAARQKGMTVLHLQTGTSAKIDAKTFPLYVAGPKEKIVSESGVLALLKEKKIANVLLIDFRLDQTMGSPVSGSSDRFGPALLKESGFQVLFVRDLTACPEMPVDNNASNLSGHFMFRPLEDRIGYMERHLCPSVDSGCLTGKASFRFSFDQRRKVVFLVSDDHYHAEKILPLFAKYLSEKKDWFCTVVTGEGTSDFYHYAELEDCDAVVVYFRRLAVPAGLKALLEKHLAEGKGLLGMRTASHAFEPKKEVDAGYVIWPEFDRVVQGGNYHNHGPNTVGTDVENVAQLANHPILTGVQPARWHSVGSLYYTGPVANDATVLQYGSYIKLPKEKPATVGERQVEPLTWIRNYGSKNAKVAYTGLGHPDDFSLPVVRQLLENLIQWTMPKK